MLQSEYSEHSIHGILSVVFESGDQVVNLVGGVSEKDYVGEDRNESHEFQHVDP